MKDLVIWLRGTDSAIAMIALVLLYAAVGFVWILSIAVAIIHRNLALALLVLFGVPVGLLYLAYWYDCVVKK